MNYDFPDHISGDTFNGVDFQVNVNGSPCDLTGYTIKIEVKRTQVAGKVLTLTTVGEDGGISIIDPPAGRFTVLPVVVALRPATYFYDIEFSKDGVVKTWVSGTWKIINDITR